MNNKELSLMEEKTNRTDKQNDKFTRQNNVHAGLSLRFQVAG